MSISPTSAPAGAVSVPCSLPAGPQGNWLLGSLADFRRDLLRFYTHCADRYGDIVPYRLGYKRHCLLNHPDFIEQVLTTESKSYSKRTYILDLLVPVLGNGLLTSEGDFWLRQRRLIQPAFNKQRVQAYGEVVVKYSLRMLDRWRDGQALDLHAEMMRLALEIVGKTLFDAEVGNHAADVGIALQEVMNQFINRWESVLPMPAIFPTPANRRFQRNLKTLNAIIYKMIAQHRQRADGQKRDDLLSLLLQARDQDDGTGMTDLQLRDEMMTLFLAGHETTANALSWTIYLLAQHPEVEERLRAKLATALKGRPPTVADLPHLVYCEHVLQESLRLYPPAYAFGRLARVESTIGGYRVPAGTTVILSPWVTHRDARWFSDPLAFRPERWAEDQVKQSPHYSYFPFGGGARICIGSAFAMMEATLVLATVMPQYHFTLRPDPPVVPLPVVTLRPAQGIPVTLAKL